MGRHEVAEIFLEGGGQSERGGLYIGLHMGRKLGRLVRMRARWFQVSLMS